MTQILLVGLVVLLCAGYWLQRLAPSAMIPLWRALAGLLAATQALPGLRTKAERLATPPAQAPAVADAKAVMIKTAGATRTARLLALQRHRP